MSRIASIERKTAETTIRLRIDLDGSGKSSIHTGVGFFDHMLTLFAKHGCFDLEVAAQGDLQVDQHHTVEDVGICLGQTFRQALGDKTGIRRYGHFTLPMEETLITSAVDLSGRYFLVFQALAEAFPVARSVFSEVDDALSQNLSHLMFDGPEDELTLTANAQPALMAVSMAMIKVLESEAGITPQKHARYVAGHSLGEYSALAAAKSLSLADTARLLRIRGNAMQAAVAPGVGAMAALLGLDFDVAAAVADEAAQGEVCQAANDNGGGQVVVSGAKAAVERAVELAKARGARRAVGRVAVTR